MESKNNFGLIIAILVLCLLVVGLGGFIVYREVFNRDTNEEILNNENESSDNGEIDLIEFEEFEIGQRVQVRLNDDLIETFYVLRDSGSDEEYLTLFAPRNIGNSAFNNDLTDGNEFNGSLIQNKLNQLTYGWINVRNRRLITVEEMINTGLTKTERSCVGLHDCVYVDLLFARADSWLLYTFTNEMGMELNEMFWTMTKGENDWGGHLTNAYVYYVHMGGEINTYIVGYAPGSQWNPDGTLGSNSGIRPVVEISKRHVER